MPGWKALEKTKKNIRCVKKKCIYGAMAWLGKGGGGGGADIFGMLANHKVLGQLTNQSTFWILEGFIETGPKQHVQDRVEKRGAAIM